MKRKYVSILSKILLFVLLISLVTACGQETLPATPTAGVVPTGSTAEEPGANVAEEVAATVVARTPEPTPTPGVIQNQVSEFTESTKLAGKTFLGLTVENWINLTISVLFFVVGYLLTVRLLYHFIQQVVLRAGAKFYKALFESIGPELRWLVGLFFLRFAIFRLDFLSSGFRLILGDMFFILGLVLLTRIALQLINFAVEWYKKNLGAGKDETRLDPVILLLQHSSYILIIITAVIIGLAHFGLANNALSAFLVVITIGLLLAAKDTISDVISGFIILVDQPFRVGDAIQVEGWDEWGRVTEIGSRTTRVKTWDNQLVIVPNSNINASQVINYTYPDPTYRMRTDIRLAYGADLARIRTIIEKTMHGIEEVLPDKPVEILFRQFGDSTRLIRVHWWVASCDKEFYMADRVNAAVETALAEAGFAVSFTTYKVDLNAEGKAPAN